MTDVGYEVFLEGVLHIKGTCCQGSKHIGKFGCGGVLHFQKLSERSNVVCCESCDAWNPLGTSAVNQKQEYFLGKISLRALIIRGNQVLICRDNLDTDIWQIPGGRLHKGESLEEGLKREIFEELGAQISIVRLIYTEQFSQTRDGSLHLLLAYLALCDTDMLIVPDQQEISEFKWIDRNMLGQDKLYPNCLNAIRALWKL